ncbi:PIG-L family deacetylase [Flexithrix dorotheae]|uniref:PIG-L family deacetylase n=1 Tax=Flexithrix dorotheae TaxID=70993 RepID=UPI00037C8305|nr:PIG-L family deacetylase [Flexithrix dorotheae]
MSHKPIKSAFILLAILILPFEILAQAGPDPSKNSSEIKHALNKLQVLGSVLYVAAHPDDENTRMITYMANEKGMRTAYLSLTRGDGGQNLIGKEVREQMGLIRTQELLAARRTDGGEQFFSRANDFGYSKHPDETLTIWDKEKVLADAVWVIRKFKPDVIITRFSPYRDGETHGHHTTSAKIALEAFSAAADPNRFPEQLEFVAPWQAKRILWNTSWWFFRTQKNHDYSQYLKIDAGAYNTLLGKSYGEIAAESRSMHKSQGFGASKQRGSEIEYLGHLAGDSAATDLFEGIVTNWDRVDGSEKVKALIKKAIANYNIEKPSASLSTLLKAHAEITKLPADNHYVNLKKQELEDLILQCAGIWADANSKVYSTSPGDSLFVTARIIKRSEAKVVLKEIDYQYTKIKNDSLLEFNKLVSVLDSFKIPTNLSYSQPYWLKETPLKGMFQVENQELIGLPENEPPLSVIYDLEIESEGINREISLVTPVMYRWVDPADGEKYRPLAIAPPVTANIAEQVYIFANQEALPVNIVLKSNTQDIEGELTLDLPKGWKVSPDKIPFSFKEKFEELNTTFQVTPPVGQSIGKVKALVKIGDQILDYSLKIIDYPHIPVQTIFPKAEAKLAKLDIQIQGKKIGYIMGSGDAVPEALRQIGYTVDILSDEDINTDNLSQYDAVITGVRTYNTNSRMKFHQKYLMEYVEKGGNVIVQYNTSRTLSMDLGPYPLKISRDRVTVEEAEVKLLNPNHEILNFPNKITEADFDGWVQERGLYFPNEWDNKYEAILSMNDPGEEAKSGSLLVTQYGEGNYIYTGLSFFRELPAGVPGAYRLLANLIGYGKKEPLKLETAK